jgi:hypothetical protein
MPICPYGQDTLRENIRCAVQRIRVGLEGVAIMNMVSDKNGNRVSVDLFPDPETALATLVNCRNCVNCVNMNNCTDCIDSYGCSFSANCRACAYCYDCRNCECCLRCSHYTSCRNCYAGKHYTDPVPIIENIHKAVYEAASCSLKYDLPKLVVQLAGDQGSDLEKKTCYWFAAMLIYQGNGHLINPALFKQSLRSLAWATLQPV